MSDQEKRERWIIYPDEIREEHEHWAPILKDPDHRVSPLGRFNDVEGRARAMVVIVADSGTVLAQYVTNCKPTFATKEGCELWIGDRDLGEFFEPWCHVRLAAPGQSTPAFDDNCYADVEPAGADDE